MWWSISAAQGANKAKIGLGELETRMPQAERETAQKLAREWMEKHPK